MIETYNAFDITESELNEHFGLGEYSSNKEAKFKVMTDAGEFVAPSANFSLCLHDTGHKLLTWSSDGIVDELQVTAIRQYTGLKDKNGTEIYEGDIVKSKPYDFEPAQRLVGVVRYFTDSCSFHVASNYLEQERLEEWAENEVEVIGDLHSNLDILEAE